MPHATLVPPSPAAASGSVARIVYASRSRLNGPAYAEMERIRAAALRHNVPLGVHTALLSQSGWFIQWKEGPGTALRALMERVATDPRHEAMCIVHASRGPRLLHGPWSMAIVQTAEQPGDVEARVQALRRQRDGGRQASPPAVWRQLSTPLTHAGAHRQHEPAAFQRVLVCAARGTASFGLVHWLASGSRQPLVHRRFAGAQALDVATDYVDFEAGGRMLRVIAMARRGLALPLTRAFLPDYSHLLLLLSDDDAFNRALLRRVALACAGLPETPALLAVAPRAPLHGPLADGCARLGLPYEALVAADGAAPAWTAARPALARWDGAERTAAAASLHQVLAA